MPNLQKTIKLTKAQYDTLAGGGTVGNYTGLDPTFLYLVEEGLDTTPTSGSSNPVTSGGVYTAINSLDGKIDEHCIVNNNASGSSQFVGGGLEIESASSVGGVLTVDGNVHVQDGGRFEIYQNKTSGTRGDHCTTQYGAYDVVRTRWTKNGSKAASTNTYNIALPDKSGTIALTSDISQVKSYKHNVSVYFSGNTLTTGGSNTLATFLIQFEFIDTQANINTWSDLVTRMLNSFPNNTEVRFPCNGWIRYQSDGFYYFVTSLTREGNLILINGKAANSSLGDIYVYLNGSESVNYYNNTTEIAVPAVMTSYSPTTVWSGSVAQSGGSKTLSDISGASTLDDGIWRITVTYQGATIGITLLIADGKGYGYGGESSMSSYNVYMVGLQYESGTFWARGTTFKGSSNNYGSGSVSDVAFQATITYKKIERLVSF